jgi:hypothetical protein
MNLKEVRTETLWKMLSDISSLKVMQEEPTADNDYYYGWFKVSKSILLEIDKRMKEDHEK